MPYLVGVDASASAQGRFYVDAFYQVPWGEDEGYVESIVRIVKQHHVDIVLPGSDQESFVLSRNRDLISAAGAVTLASPTEVLDLIRDKQATYKALEAAGIHVPDYVCVFKIAELQAAITNCGYPNRSVIVKPVAGRGGRGLRVLVGNNDTPASWIGGGAREMRLDTPPTTECMSEWFTSGPLMVMPVLKDPAYDVDVFAVKGKVKHALVRQRVNPAGIPFAGNHIISDTPIREYCLAVAEAIGLDGLHDIDLMTDDQGRPALLEINPRMSGSVAAAHAIGFPIVSAAVAEFLGIQYPIMAPKRNIDVALVSRAVIVRNQETKS
jgi:carbamoyl-phosphate synthase large subunit